MMPSDANPSRTNRLAETNSPYLLQHATNPVDWYPWGEEAFQRSRDEDKPIFLSVGYSTCYWCHAMERDSFERDDVAAILNEHFVAVKVDREQLPDVDEQYMLATQLLTGRAGWPNSVWLTPEGKPWMAGTYFPRDYFMQLLRELAEVWRTRREEINQQADQLADAIREVGRRQEAPSDRRLSPELIDRAAEGLRRTFDARQGGFGNAPKFPPHDALRFLVDRYDRTGDGEALAMLTRTLDAMAAGGIRDHLGGGFHRYATDRRWLLPHFEKMLYDNAQLLRAYADGYRLTGREIYGEVVEQLVGWVRRELTDPTGGFYCGIDAESEKQEGKFFVWPYNEILDVLGESDGRLFAEVYGCRPEGNFTEEATGHRSGMNVLHLPRPVEEFCRENGLDPAALKAALPGMRERLLAVREQRIHPHCDDKILTAWNGLMIDALAYAARYLDRHDYLDHAIEAADWIMNDLRTGGRLPRTYRAGNAEGLGYADDYAYTARALVELYETSRDRRWLDGAIEMADILLEQFEDREHGGFYLTSADHASLLLRSKGLFGGGNLPSHNGVAVELLLRLSEAAEQPRYLDAARRTLEGLSGLLWQQTEQADALVLAAGMVLDES